MIYFITNENIYLMRWRLQSMSQQSENRANFQKRFVTQTHTRTKAKLLLLDWITADHSLRGWRATYPVIFTECVPCLRYCGGLVKLTSVCL